MSRRDEARLGPRVGGATTRIVYRRSQLLHGRKNSLSYGCHRWSRGRSLRHTFAYRLAAETGKDAYELERRLGHGSQRYIQRYTNPPEDVAAGYVEDF